MIDDNTAYNALKSRDLRFDGVFFVGVSSTGIYCRPICPARTPKQENCRFFTNYESAEKIGFRPCLRCRPELAPGNAPMDKPRQMAHLIAQQLSETTNQDSENLESIAKKFNLSSRQLRRIVKKEFAVSPIELIQIRRLLLAKQLLTETKLPIIEIAYASGFSSLRRFNDAFKTHYRMAPTHLRKAALKNEKSLPDSTLTLQLSYRPPYDWDNLLLFLQARMVKGVEYISANCYLRTVNIGKYKGWIKVTHAPKKTSLLLELTHSLVPVLAPLLNRVRNLFDLNTRPDLINSHLLQDNFLAQAVNKNPGLRVPGAFDSFEMVVRAILGQQITVKAATTLACRFAAAFGEAYETPFVELNRFSPTADFIAECSISNIAELGIISARAKSILAFSEAFKNGFIELKVGMDPDSTIQKLITLPGIGQWTANYIAMRALRWPDAFPKEDIAIRNNLGGLSTKEAEELSQAWRPWRSYAVMHIWQNGFNRN